MIDSIIDVVPLWVFAVAAGLVIAAVAYTTFVAGYLATWVFWALLGTLVVGAVVGLLKGLTGGGL